jgi:hypothetical protein
VTAPDFFLPENRRRLLVALTWSVIVISTVYRFTFAGATFFLDEIWVVDVVQEGRYWPGLPQPPLFFFTAVLAESGCGAGELCLRLPAALFALLLTLVPLVSYRWTRDLTSHVAVLLWTTGLAFSSPLVFYSARVKQYPAEAFATAAVLAAFLSVVASPASAVRWRTYFALCTAFVLLMHSTPFVLLGTGVALTYLEFPRNRRVAAGGLAAHAALALLFAAAYVGYVRPRSATTAYFGDLHDYFRDFPVFFDGTWRFALDSTRHWVGHLLNLTPPVAVPALAILLWLGIIVRRRDPRRIAIVLACCLPPLGVLGASAFEAYPYGEVRLMIFCAPALFLLIALAITDLMSTSRMAKMLGGAASTVFFVAFIAREVSLHPYNTTYMHATDQGSTYAFIEANHPAGVPIFCRSKDAAPLRRYLPSHAADVVTLADRAPAVPTHGTRESWFLLPETERPAGALILLRGNPSVMRLGPAAPSPLTRE